MVRGIGKGWLIAAAHLFTLSSLYVATSEAAFFTNRYYGKDFHEQRDNLYDSDLKSKLAKILRSGHVVDSRQQFDQIIARCPSKKAANCFQHQQLSYREARRFLFGYLHLRKIQGQYKIKAVYCSKYFGPKDFPKGKKPGPDRIPNSRVLNAEHTWPQSRFSRHHPTEMQKSDLHALYPGWAISNSVRSNHEFSEVTKVLHRPCGKAKKGFSPNGGNRVYFEPPDEHKGNVARALFYFSIRYGLRISSVEEAYLKKWHELDPVDENEEVRHEEVAEFQKVRNPFVDHPELAEQISDF